jgi:uncharacterized membrane protein
VGSYYNTTNHGFLYNGGSVTTIDVPGATVEIEAFGINDAGQIAGRYGDATGGHGFLYSGDSFTQVDVPGVTFTEVFGINDAGQTAGRYLDATGYHGFLDSGGSFTPINVPGTDNGTQVFGINDTGKIVGRYEDTTCTGVPEPSSLLLLGCGLLGLAAWRWKRAA